MNNTRRNILYITFSLFILIILSFSIVSFFSSDTLSEITYVKWDGEEIASSFSGGNGTEVNPYRITTGGELMYFKKTIEETGGTDKYYELDANIDLDNHEITPIGTEDRHFKGVFNGNGYNINNINIKEGVEEDEIFYFGLFSKIEGSVYNLNINKMTITPDNDNVLILGSLTGSLEEKSVVRNISIQEVNVYLSDTKENNNSNISLFSGVVSKDNEITNISVFGKYYSPYSKNVSIISNKIDSSVSNVIYKIEYEDEIKTNGVEVFNNIGKELEKDEKNTDKVEFKNIYHFIDKDKIVIDEEEYELDKVVDKFNEEIKDDYYWSFEDKFILNKGKPVVEENNTNNDNSSKGPSTRSFSFTPSGPIALHNSGISTTDKTAYINDLTSDYNYYMGLNYTGDGTVSSTPTGNSYNLYSDSNLAKVYIAYRGHSIDNTTDVGYVSLDEQISDFVYYKYYPVDNGYINIPLIDNPYADRPNNLAFNGWMTDYSGAVLSYDAETYTRYVKIPTASSPISITMYATWTEATVINASVNNNNLVTTGLKSVGMYPLVSRRPDYSGNNLPTLYTRESVTSGANAYGSVPYPSGALNEYGNTLNNSTCDPIVTGSGWNRRYTANTCYYYMLADNTNIDPSTSYYYIANNGRMAAYTLPSPAGYVYDRIVPVDSSVASFYKKHTNTGSLVGYYNNQGVQYTSGNCTRNCEYYELVQFSETNVMTADDYDVYYYLATRDTNIAFLVEDIRGFTNSVPVTVTGINNGVDHSDYEIETNTRSIRAGADLRVEYANVNRNSYSTGTSGPSNSNTNYIYGEYHNLKIGRGIPIDTTTTTEWQYIDGRYQQVQVTRKYLTANAVVGGSSSDTGTTPVKYNLIVESGYYNTLSAVSTTSSSANYYTNAVATYGCDFDRVNNADNSKLGVYYTAASSWGGYVRSGSTTELFSTQIVKSGKFGEVQSEAASGIYAGGLNGGTIYSPARLIIEGGDIFNVNGGPLISSNNKSLNMIYINMKGGEADFIFGGAALTTTYGNRIINVTGGTVNYSVFGGSNGVNGGNGDGTLDGDSFIYIGGNAQIGDDTSADPVWGAEAGSVFGIGNGNSSYDTIGSANNSNIVIGGEAVIKKNVYGGGNYGGVGRSGNGSTTTTKINVVGGTVEGNVYGGGNNNGSGTTSKVSTITITMDDGSVTGSVYGGSRTKGIIYGNTNVNINAGTIGADVYGGGEGGYTNNNNPGTFVERNVNVTIGNSSSTTSNLQINGSVYGGSAFGSVNGSSNNSSTTNYTTNVTVNNGLIKTNVYGGGKGSSSYTPKEFGDVTVNINGGNISDVYGGNDQSGSPQKGDVVNLNGGTIANGFGGGNNTGQSTTNINLIGTTMTGNLYGGSNNGGTVTTSNVHVTGGSVVDIYGGNNMAGSTTTTNVTVDSGTITGDIYGGGNQADSGETNVNISANVNNVYGGGNQAGVSSSTNVIVSKGTMNGVYGGSNQSGTVGTTNVTVEPNLSNYHDDYTSGGSGLEVSFNYRFSSAQYQTELYPEYQTIVDITPVFRNTTAEDFDEWSVTLNVPNSTFFVHDGDANIIVNGELYTWNQDDRWWGTNPIPAGSTYSPSLPLRVLFKGTEEDFRLIYDLEAIDGNNGIHKKTNDPNYVSPTQGGGINIATIYGGNNIGGTVSTSNVAVNNGIIGEIYGGGNQVGLTTSNVEVTGGRVTSVYGGSNRNGNVTTSNVTIGGENTLNITDVYGGNNLGGRVTQTNVTVTQSNITNLYGGGNKAPVGSTNLTIGNGTIQNLYGGGNEAEVTGNTLLDVDNASIPTNLYGGGNQGVVRGNTEVYITDSTIGGSIYAGGNGSSAIVSGNTTITVDGNTTVGSSSSTGTQGSVFGGGNAAATGTEANNNSVATVNIVGGHIYGNVYGGANTSVVYGETNTNIGSNVVGNSNLTEADLIIEGTVFGGGEANASGSDTYDFSFISVTKGIEVNIDGKDYLNHNHRFELNGSIFGSGNASSSAGTSEVYIRNLGTRTNPSTNVSIQRADKVVIDNSVIELSGTVDTTNDYSNIKYSLNRIDDFMIKNNSVLLLKENANLLKTFKSMVGTDGHEEIASVSINDDTQTVTKNVDNRLYMLAGKNLNVATNQDATAYGEVHGMTFFGMYTVGNTGSRSYGVYSDSFDYGSSSDAGDIIIGGSYVKGSHHANHDITVDGFYSNYLDEENNYSSVTVAYVEPQPPSSNFYIWSIGEDTISYEFTMTASKYGSLGTYTLSMGEFADGDSIFNVVGFNAEGLATGVSLVDSDTVPKVAHTQAEANSVLGLSMKAETREWTSYGTTKLLSSNSGEYTGTNSYKTDSQSLAPQLMFYFYHAKNIALTDDLGTVVLMLQALTPKNEIEYNVQLVTIIINLEAVEYDDEDAYDASITYDKKYEMPSATSVNITNKSQFTAYYSMIAMPENFQAFYGRNGDYYHALVTDSPLPVGTEITMIDNSIDGHPEEYYLTVDQAMYNASVQQLSQDNEITYKLSSFIKMDSTSTNNKYDDITMNQVYFDSTHNLVMEEFLFIFDFKNTNISGGVSNKYMLFELRNIDDRTMYHVVTPRRQVMFYSTFDSSNSLLSANINPESHLYYDIDSTTPISTEVGYEETEGRESIIDTNYESSAMGLNLAILDHSGNQVSSSLLTGTSVTIGNEEHYADSDGVFRIKLAGKVSNINSNMTLKTDISLPTGTYTFRFTLFASSDGLHNSNPDKATVYDRTVTVVGSDNSIVATGDDKNKVVDGITSLNELGAKYNDYTIKYVTVLEDANLRVSLYKRKIDNSESTVYDEVNFNSLFTNTLSAPSGDYTPASAYEKMITMSESPMSVRWNLADNLTSGTYKVIFKLYDGNQLVDTDNEFVIVKKATP